jgi:signal transduction histidine kinase
MAVPIMARGEVLGRITVGTELHSRSFTTRDLTAVEDFAHRCAFAIENARLYEEAQAAVRARDEFLSVASHELRTPLTPLRIQLQRLIGTRLRPPMQNVTPERLREILQRSERHVQRLGALIDNLLDVSRITSGRLSIDPEQLELTELVTDVVGRFREEVAHTGSTVTLHCEGEVSGRWDRLRIEQVVTNLLTNAVKYGQGKPIAVHVIAGEERAMIEVHDHGIGIPKDKQEHIFDRFERAVPSRAYGGLGLGLFITRQILDAHGGSIRVESEPEQGAIFVVDLPLQARQSLDVPETIARHADEQSIAGVQVPGAS